MCGLLLGLRVGWCVFVDVSVFALCCLSLVDWWLLFAVCRLMRCARCVLRGARCLLFVGCRLLCFGVP